MDNQNHASDPVLASDERLQIPAYTSAALDFEDHLIEHPRFEKAYRQIDDLRLRNLAVIANPIRNKRNKKLSLLVIGDPNSGKSTFLEFYKDKEIDRAKELGRKSRVLLVKMKGNPTYSDFAALLLQEVTNGQRKPSRQWTEKTLTATVKTGLENLKTEVILIDEAHHLTKNKNADARKEILTFLKSLMDEVRPIFVFAGTSDLLHLHKDLEIESRLEARVELHYSWDFERDDFAAQAALFVENTGLKTKLNFLDNRWAARLYYVTGGRIGNVVKFLSKTVEIAHREAKNGKKLNLTRELLADVFEYFSSAIDQKDEIRGPFDDIQKRSRINNPFILNDSDFDRLWRKKFGAKRLDVMTQIRRLEEEAEDQAETENDFASAAH